METLDLYAFINAYHKKMQLTNNLFVLFKDHRSHRSIIDMTEFFQYSSADDILENAIKNGEIPEEEFFITNNEINEFANFLSVLSDDEAKEINSTIVGPPINFTQRI